MRMEDQSEQKKMDIVLVRSVLPEFPQQISNELEALLSPSAIGTIYYQTSQVK